MQSKNWILIGSIAVTGIAAAMLFFIWPYHTTRTEVWASFWAILVGVTVTIVLLATAPDKKEFLNYFLFALCGGALGWVIGIVASPATSEEERVFGEYKTAIVGFLSGFAVSKINDLWKLLSEGPQPRLFTPGVLNRVLLFFGIFFLLVANQYNLRQANIGQLIVSASVQPAEALISQSLGSVTITPGATVTLKGAAAFPEMDVDWNKRPDSGAFPAALTLKAATVTVPDDSALKEAVDGDQATFVATSRYNKSRTGTLVLILKRPPKAAGGAAKEPPKANSTAAPATTKAQTP
jgi:hypothetical protein